jgi:hypothetical protein
VKVALLDGIFAFFHLLLLGSSLLPWISFNFSLYLHDFLSVSCSVRLPMQHLNSASPPFLVDALSPIAIGGSGGPKRTADGFGTYHANTTTATTHAVPSRLSASASASPPSASRGLATAGGLIVADRASDGAAFAHQSASPLSSSSPHSSFSAAAGSATAAASTGAALRQLKITPAPLSPLASAPGAVTSARRPVVGTAASSESLSARSQTHAHAYANAQGTSAAAAFALGSGAGGGAGGDERGSEAEVQAARAAARARGAGANASVNVLRLF